MKILITGAAGDVGAKVTIALLEKGHQVKVLVRRVSGSLPSLPLCCHE